MRYQLQRLLSYPSDDRTNFVRDGSIAAPAGLEPALTGVTGRYFNRLNYGTVYPVFTGYLLR